MKNLRNKFALDYSKVKMPCKLIAVYLRDASIKNIDVSKEVRSFLRLLEDKVYATNN